MFVLALVVPFVILALLGMAALGSGVDTRDDFDDPRAPARGLFA